MQLSARGERVLAFAEIVMTQQELEAANVSMTPSDNAAHVEVDS